MVSYQSTSWNHKVDEFEDYLKKEGIPKISKDKKWYIWMIHQRIYYHRNEFHLKHDENRKRWEELCKEYNISNQLKQHSKKKNEYIKKKEFKDLLEKCREFILFRHGSLPKVNKEDKTQTYWYNWIKSQKRNYKKNEFSLKEEENRKLWEDFSNEFSITFRN